MVGGFAWFFIIASVVFSVRWVQDGNEINMFVFVPGALLTLLTQVQWTAHRAQHGPPPTGAEDKQEAASATAAPPPEEEPKPAESAPHAAPPRRRRRRRGRAAG